MNSTLGLIIFAVVFGGIIILVIVGAIRRREMSFEGVVIDKDIIENQQMNNGINSGNGIMMGGGMNGGVTHEYMTKIKTDAGKEIHYKISQGMYEIIKIGDRVSKVHGTTDLTIVSSPPSPAAAVTQPAQMVQPAPVATVAPVVPAAAVVAATPEAAPTPPTPPAEPPQSDIPPS